MTPSPLTSVQAYQALVGAYIERLQGLSPSNISWPVGAQNASQAFQLFMSLLNQAGDTLGTCTYNLDGKMVSARMTEFECVGLGGTFVPG